MAQTSDRLRRLSNLNVSLRRRFLRSQVPADLTETIDVARQAVDAAPESPSGRTAVLANPGLLPRKGVTSAATPASPSADPARLSCSNRPAGR